MIRQIKLNKGDVLCVTDESGHKILLLALTECHGDNELLVDPCDTGTAYNQSSAARSRIQELLNPDD